MRPNTWYIQSNINMFKGIQSNMFKAQQYDKREILENYDKWFKRILTKE